MFIKRFAPLILTMLFVFLVALVSANDDQGNPNDPVSNDNANACYEDGSMASKCDSEWEWMCGWFIIRFENGAFSADEVPETCQILIDSPTETPEYQPSPTKLPA